MDWMRKDKIISKILTRIKEVDHGYKTKCWDWQGPDSGSGRGGGYPRMCLDGATVAVHIVIYVCCFGYIHGKRQVDHLCNNRMCCNPDHLEAVTYKTNQKRRDQRNKCNDSIDTPT